MPLWAWAYTAGLPSGGQSRRSWTESLRSQTNSGGYADALSTFIQMRGAGVFPDQFVFPAVLKAATALQDLNFGEHIHACAVKFGYCFSSVAVSNTLLHMYGQCGDSLYQVCKVFDGMPQRNQVSWNSFINALCHYEEWDLALDAFRAMQLDMIDPSSYTLVSMALACCNLKKDHGLRLGKQVHAYSLKFDEECVFINNSLMTMYAKLGRIDDAKIVFDVFCYRNVVSWNRIISAFSQCGRFYEALECFVLMRKEGFMPDGVAVATVLPACSHLRLLKHGKEIHAYAFKNGYLVENPFVVTALVDMYCSCKNIASARFVFDGIVDGAPLELWNAMLAGYTENGLFMEALVLFMELMAVSDHLPSPTTISCVLPACVECEAFEDKELMHGYVLKLGLGRDVYVQNALMDMYSRIGNIESSRFIFQNMERKDVVSWNTMITGFVISGCHEDALVLVSKMGRSERNNQESRGFQDNTDTVVKPNSVTLISALPGCAALVALAKGKEVHAFALRNAFERDVAVSSALIDMYAKCGCLDNARGVFDAMPYRNVITWNTMIMAYGMHGEGDEAMDLFKNMVYEEMKPNELTFIVVFAACSHSGLVDEGLLLFKRMKEDYGVEPTSDHYTCIVDMLGRAGRLNEAQETIVSMPVHHGKVGAWCSLLGACRLNKDTQLGELAGQNLLHLDPNVASHYVLLSNIYSSAGLWEKADRTRKTMKESGVQKQPGCSWMIFGGQVHRFVAGDTSHPESVKLYQFLDDLSSRMKAEGYAPDTSCVLHNISEHEKETLLCGHSERLAIAFGIMNTPPGTVIRVAKNLRVCNDCHSVTKFISKIASRKIVVRDVKRFHHFHEGACSCGDYW